MRTTSALRADVCFTLFASSSQPSRYDRSLVSSARVARADGLHRPLALGLAARSASSRLCRLWPAPPHGAHPHPRAETPAPPRASPAGDLVPQPRRAMDFVSAVQRSGWSLRWASRSPSLARLAPRARHSRRERQESPRSTKGLNCCSTISTTSERRFSGRPAGPALLLHFALFDLFRRAAIRAAVRVPHCSFAPTDEAERDQAQHGRRRTQKAGLFDRAEDAYRLWRGLVRHRGSSRSRPARALARWLAAIGSPSTRRSGSARSRRGSRTTVRAVRRDRRVGPRVLRGSSRRAPRDVPRRAPSSLGEAARAMTRGRRAGGTRCVVLPAAVTSCQRYSASARSREPGPRSPAAAMYDPRPRSSARRSRRCRSTTAASRTSARAPARAPYARQRRRCSRAGAHADLRRRRTPAPRWRGRGHAVRDACSARPAAAPLPLRRVRLEPHYFCISGLLGWTPTRRNGWIIHDPPSPPASSCKGSRPLAATDFSPLPGSRRRAHLA